MAEPITLTAGVVGIGMAVSGIGNAFVNYYNGKKNIEYQEKRDTENLQQQEKNFKKQIKHLERIAKENHAAQYELQKDAQEFQTNFTKENHHDVLRINQHPLLRPTKDIEDDAIEGVLRCFICPPEHIALKEENGREWNDIYINNLTFLIKEFIQKYYSSNSPRHIDFFGPRIINPNPHAARGNDAIRILQKELIKSPTIWLESNRLNSGESSLEFSIWDKDTNPSETTLIGKIPNYIIAKQTQQNISKPTILDKQGNKLQNNPAHHNIPQNEEVSILSLAESYKMLLAGSADLFYLKSGVSPLLPRLIHEGVFDMNNPFIDTKTTCSILESYQNAAIKLAHKTPEQAPLIWLGIGETFAAIGQKEAAKDSIIQSIHYAAKQRNMDIPQTPHELKGAVRAIAPSMGEIEKSRLKNAIENTELSYLIEEINSKKPHILTTDDKAISGKKYDWMEHAIGSLSQKQ